MEPSLPTTSKDGASSEVPGAQVSNGFKSPESRHAQPSCVGPVGVVENIPEDAPGRMPSLLDESFGYQGPNTRLSSSSTLPPQDEFASLDSTPTQFRINMSQERVLYLKRENHRLRQELQQLQQQERQPSEELKEIFERRSAALALLQDPDLPSKASTEPGKGANHLKQYLYDLRNRPKDNNIGFWRKFVAEYFAQNAKRKWCLSNCVDLTAESFFGGHCRLCKRNTRYCFEASVDLLPRLFKIAQDDTLEELVILSNPREYENSFGQTVLDDENAIEKSIFKDFHVTRKGHLRIVFSPELKICSWNFCAHDHKVLVPTSPVSQATENESSNSPTEELQTVSSVFPSAAGQQVKSLEVRYGQVSFPPMLGDRGYMKRFVQCLEMSAVIISMGSLIGLSKHASTGPLATLRNLARTAMASASANNSVGHTRQHSMNIASNPGGGNSVQSVSSNLNSTTPHEGFIPLQSPMFTSANNLAQTYNSPFPPTNHVALTSSYANIPVRQPDANADDNEPTWCKIVREVTASAPAINSVRRTGQHSMNIASNTGGGNSVQSVSSNLNSTTPHEGFIPLQSPMFTSANNLAQTYSSPFPPTNHVALTSSYANIPVRQPDANADDKGKYIYEHGLHSSHTFS